MSHCGTPWSFDLTPFTTALFTGVTDKDNAQWVAVLLDKGSDVHGINRRAGLFNTNSIDCPHQNPHSNHQRFKPGYRDPFDSTTLIRVVQLEIHHEIYNLTAEIHVAVSFETPDITASADYIGAPGKPLKVLRTVALDWGASAGLEPGGRCAGEPAHCRLPQMALVGRG